MSEAELSGRIADAEAARGALDRWLGPAFDVVRADYMEKLASIAAQPLPVHGVAQIEKLAIAVKVVDAVRAQIEAVAQDGKVARHDKTRADKLAETPAYARKRWGF